MNEIIALIVSVFSLLISLVIAYRQIVLIRQQNALPIIVNMFELYRTKDFKIHQEFIFNELQKKHSSELGYYQLPEPARTHVLTYSHYMDHLGMLVAHGIISKKMVISFIGNRIYDSWLILKPYIDFERTKRKHGYQQFYENLAYEVKMNPPWKLKNDLKLKGFS